MKKTQSSGEEAVISPKYPQWLNDTLLNRDYGESLYKILLFFVVFSPCPRFCTQGRTLQFYHWKEKPWSTNRYLKNKLDDDVFTDKKSCFCCVEKKSLLMEAFGKTDLGDDFYLHRETERVAFVKVESNGYMSLFHHIRCALAHGRFSILKDAVTNDIVFVMENGTVRGDGFQVTARMILRENTLLKWIDIITAGPSEAERDYAYDVYMALLRNKKLRVKDLARMLGESKYTIDKALSFLKRSKILVYHDHGKNSWYEINNANAQAYFHSRAIQIEVAC